MITPSNPGHPTLVASTSSAPVCPPARGVRGGIDEVLQAQGRVRDDVSGVDAADPAAPKRAMSNMGIRCAAAWAAYAPLALARRL